MRFESAVPLLVAVAVAAACGDSQRSPAGASGVDAGGSGCGPLGAPCVTAVADAEAWRAIAAPPADAEGLRATIFVAPRSPAAPPILFANAARIISEGGDAAPAALRARLASLSASDADSGTIVERDVPSLGTVYLYDVRNDAGWSCAAHEGVHRTLSAAFAPRPLYRARLRSSDSWHVPGECDLPTLIVQISEVEYEAYTVGSSYGSVRALRTGQVAVAAREGELGWRDILVLEQTPFDVENVIAGAVTGTRQGQLSHLNIRSAARGTPNCFVRDAYAKLAAWDGKLAKITCGPTSFSIEEADPVEAEAWRQAFRPKPAAIAPPDESAVALIDLLEIPTTTPQERALAARRYGAKASNLAALYQRTDPALTLEGFAIPVVHYRRFVRDSVVTVTDGGGAARALTLEALVRETLADPAFLASGKVRRDRLATLRAAFAAAPCSPPLLEEIAARAALTKRGAWGVWRFRSSSNAEDLAAFNGAGLYTSQSGCVADDRDGDETGPSQCEASRKRERTACDAVRAVWGSLWELRAYEERTWAGLSHEDAVMGVLVNEQSEDERVNMVVFSGDPTQRGDTRFLVDAQVGWLEVVAPEEGTWPETSRLRLGAEGAVTGIERIRRSSATAPGQVVLGDDELRALGAAYATIVERFPKDSLVPDGKEVIYDSEWKVLADGRLIIKQIRPFLR